MPIASLLRCCGFLKFVLIAELGYILVNAFLVRVFVLYRFVMLGLGVSWFTWVHLWGCFVCLLVYVYPIGFWCCFSACRFDVGGYLLVKIVLAVCRLVWVVSFTNCWRD